MQESDLDPENKGVESSRFLGKLIVAGIPRSGTTMVFRALAGLSPGTTTPDTEVNGVVKTHSLEPQRFTGAAWGIFLFGNPILSVVSTKLRRYDRNHFRNCGAGDLEPEEVDIFAADHLNYERMWEAWMCRQAFPLIAIRYETLHKSICHVENLLGRDICLPPFQQRKTNDRYVSADDLARIKQTYAGLRRKVSRAPDFSLYFANS